VDAPWRAAAYCLASIATRHHGVNLRRPAREAAMESERGRGRPKPSDEGQDGEALSATQILSGATIPVRMNVRIDLTRRDPDAEAPTPGSLAERLVKAEDRILRWLRASAHNRMLLLSDPPAALREIGVKLADDEWAALEAVHRAIAVRDVVPSGVSIDRLDVRVGRRRAKGD
jgi:hypothetical protein